MMIGIREVAASARIDRHTAMPLTPGSIKSRMTRSAAVRCSCCMTAEPDASRSVVSRVMEVVDDEIGDVLVVFDDENVSHGSSGCARTLKRTVEPF